MQIRRQLGELARAQADSLVTTPFGTVVPSLDSRILHDAEQLAKLNYGRDRRRAHGTRSYVPMDVPAEVAA